MSDPNNHEFLPNRKGLCKDVVGSRHCGLPEDARPHRLWRDSHPVPTQDEVNQLKSLLRNFREKFRAWNDDDSQGGSDLQEMCAEFVDEIKALGL